MLTGEWTNTVSMAYDVTTANLLQKGTRRAFESIVALKFKI